MRVTHGVLHTAKYRSRALSISPSSTPRVSPLALAASASDSDAARTFADAGAVRLRARYDSRAVYRINCTCGFRSFAAAVGGLNLVETLRLRTDGCCFLHYYRYYYYCYYHRRIIIIILSYDNVRRTSVVLAVVVIAAATGTAAAAAVVVSGTGAKEPPPTSRPTSTLHSLR